MDAELLNSCAIVSWEHSQVWEYIGKTEDTQPTIIVTKAFKVFLTGAIDVPEQHQVEANGSK